MATNEADASVAKAAIEAVSADTALWMLSIPNGPSTLLELTYEDDTELFSTNSILPAPSVVNTDPLIPSVIG